MEPAQLRSRLLEGAKGEGEEGGWSLRRGGPDVLSPASLRSTAIKGLKPLCHLVGEANPFEWEP